MNINSFMDLNSYKIIPKSIENEMNSRTTYLVSYMRIFLTKIEKN